MQFCLLVGELPNKECYKEEVNLPSNEMFEAHSEANRMPQLRMAHTLGCHKGCKSDIRGGIQQTSSAAEIKSSAISSAAKNTFFWIAGLSIAIAGNLFRRCKRVYLFPLKVTWQHRFAIQIVCFWFASSSVVKNFAFMEAMKQLWLNGLIACDFACTTLKMLKLEH